MSVSATLNMAARTFARIQFGSSIGLGVRPEGEVPSSVGSGEAFAVFCRNIHAINLFH